MRPSAPGSLITATNAAIGSTTATSIIVNACSASVTLTAQKPPTSVYSMTIDAPTMTLVVGDQAKLALNALPAPSNCAAM